MKQAAAEQNFVKQSIEASIRIGLIVLLVFWCLKIAAPFVDAILWAIIIAIGTQPIYSWIKNKTGLGSGLAATVFTLLMLVMLITPTVYLAEALMDNAQELTEDLKDGTVSIPAPPKNIANWPIVGNKLDKVWTNAHEDPESAIKKYEPQIKSAATSFIKATANLGLTILMLVFSIILAGVFLVKAKGGRETAVKIMSKLLGEKGEAYANLSHQTVQSVVRGIIGIAVLQSLLAGIGFLMMGIPGAALLALICLVLAVVQIDILIILIPLSIYAFSTAGAGAATAFLIWNIAVGLINNVLKPIVLGRGVKAPMAVIFVGAIGGMVAHGIIGLFVGAVVFVLGYTLFVEWLHEEKLVGSS